MKSKKGGKNLHVSTLMHMERIFNSKQYIDYDYLKKLERKNLRHIYSFLSTKNKTGEVMVLTHQWINLDGIVKNTQKDIVFASDDSDFTVYASYVGNPDDNNDVLFMNSIEQVFLSMEMD